MTAHLVSRSRRTSHIGMAAGTLLLLVGLFACQDKRVKELSAGIQKDSVMSILAQDIKRGAPDAYPNVYKRSLYLINGKHFEVLYFTPNDAKIGDSKDTIPLRKLTPIVLVDNIMIGKGWGYWDSVATANKISVPPKK